MSDVLAEKQELQRMRDRVREAVQSLELCWSCRRVSTCDPWLVAEGVSIWLCGQCFAEVSSRNNQDRAVKRIETLFGFRQELTDAH
jgi:hypothetical protein